MIGQHLQVEHQLGVVFKRGGHAGRLGHDRRFPRALRFGLLDARFNVTDAIEIFGESGSILSSKPLLQIGGLRRHKIEDAAVLAHMRAPRRGFRAADIAEHSLEHHAGIVLRRQRQRRGAPGKRVAHDARLALAHAGRIEIVQAQLQ